MDDLNQAFGRQRQLSAIEEAWHNEQKRKQYDIIRVSNPAKAIVKGIEYSLPPIDFYQEYDVNQYQKIAFNSTIDIPRYIAIRYVEHKKDEIINFVNQKLHDEYLADRDKRGLPRFTDKAVENKETYETQSYPKTDDTSVIAEVYNQLWIGLVHDFGRDVPPQNNNPRSGEVDLTSASMKALENLDKKRVDISQLPQAPVYQSAPVVPQATYTPPVPVESPFAKMNEQLSAEEVSSE